MNGFLIFCAQVLIFCALLGGVWYLFKSIDLPQPIKILVLVVVCAVGLIYFLQSGDARNILQGN